jgi:hypothetical protein
MAQPEMWPLSMPRPARRREVEALPTSRRLWSLDWRTELPWELPGARAQFATQNDVLPFMKEHYPSIFAQKDLDGRFLASPMTEAKSRFFSEMDYFVFDADGETAGVFMAHPTDWTTYYLRSTAILPQFRERHMLTSFFEKLDEPLRAAGVERIETDCSPANVPVVRMLSRQEYVVTGTFSSERWGLLLRYTKFLSEDARAAFTRQYTAMPISQRRDNHHQERR